MFFARSLAVRWMEKFAMPAPIEFGRLLQVAEGEEFVGAVQRLLEVKRRSPDLGLTPQIAPIWQFIETEQAD